MPITANNFFYIESGSAIQFDNGQVEVNCTVKINRDNSIQVDAEVWDTARSVFCGSVPLTYSETDLEAYTGSGTGEFSQFMNCVEQAVVDYLESVTENTGITFTIG